MTAAPINAAAKTQTEQPTRAASTRPAVTEAAAQPVKAVAAEHVTTNQHKNAAQTTDTT